MGGGEVARYFSLYGPERLHSVVFASAVPPHLMQSDDNPGGPLTAEAAAKMTADLTADEDTFYDQFTTAFFSANGQLKVTEQQRQEALALCKQADMEASLACMAAFANTDFTEDLSKVSVPTLVLHGDSDGTVPFEGSSAPTRQSQQANCTSSPVPPRLQRQPCR